MIRNFAVCVFAALMVLGGWSAKGQTIGTETVVTSEAVAADDAVGTGTEMIGTSLRRPVEAEPVSVDEETTAVNEVTTTLDEATTALDEATTSPEIVQPEATPAPAETPVPAETPAPAELEQETTGTEVAQQPESGEAPLFPLEKPAVPESDAEVVRRTGGLTYQVLREGSGREADTTSTRRIHYTLWLEDGTFVESSRLKEFPRPFQFVPGASQAISGMEQGTEGMRIGEIRKIFIPSRLAYGSLDTARVPANSNLYFVVELVDVVSPDGTK